MELIAKAIGRVENSEGAIIVRNLFQTQDDLTSWPRVMLGLLGDENKKTQNNDGYTIDIGIVCNQFYVVKQLQYKLVFLVEPGTTG